jgi:hypothetical protein
MLVCVVQKTLRGVVSWAVRSVIESRVIIERQLVEKMVVLNMKGKSSRSVVPKGEMTSH